MAFASPLQKHTHNTYTRSVELYVHIFKVGALRIAHSEKDGLIKQFHAICVKPLCPTSFAMRYLVAHEPSQAFFAMIEISQVSTLQERA